MDSHELHDANIWHRLTSNNLARHQPLDKLKRKSARNHRQESRDWPPSLLLPFSHIAAMLYFESITSKLALDLEEPTPIQRLSLPSLARRLDGPSTADFRGMAVEEKKTKEHHHHMYPYDIKIYKPA